MNSKEGAFIDVGANRGQTLIKLLSFDPDRQYVGFEPQLDCCYSVTQFIKDNSLRKHFILPIGLSNRFGVVELFKRNQVADTTASTINGFRPSDFYSSVELICVERGDEVINRLNIDQISIMKIDVEGGELEVFDGIQEVLKNKKPIIFFEVLGHFLRVTREKIDKETIVFREHRIREMENLLRGSGFSIFNILPDDNLREISKIEPKVSDDATLCDYVAIHTDHKSVFLNHFREVVAAEQL